MKIRTRFTARVVRFCDLPGRTRKRERHAELAVESGEGTPWFLTVQVPYRGGLARAEVQEGDLIRFTATHTGEESEQRMSYLFDVVVMQRAAAAVVPVPVVPSLPAAMPAVPSSAHSSQPSPRPVPIVNEVVTATVAGYDRNSDGMVVILKDITDAAGVVRRATAEVRSNPRMHVLLDIGDVITCTATLVGDRLDITEPEIVTRYRDIGRR